MTQSPDYIKLHKYHSENLKSLDSALTQIALSAKEAIRQKQNVRILFYNRLYALTLGAWAEVRLKKLLCDVGGFPEKIRKKVETEKTLFDQWSMCVEAAFSHKYNAIPAKLPKTAKLRYASIIEFMRTHLEPTITIRNKLAHGQWIYPLNSDCTNVETESKKTLQQQNIMGLQYKKEMLNAVASIIHDLVVSRPTFERDFDKHFQKIEDIERDLSTRTYQAYEKSLLSRYARGKTKRKSKS